MRGKVLVLVGVVAFMASGVLTSAALADGMRAARHAKRAPAHACYGPNCAPYVCPDRYSCGPLYGAYGPYGGVGFWGGFTYAGWGRP
jgi:hypothetical protein